MVYTIVDWNHWKKVATKPRRWPNEFLTQVKMPPFSQLFIDPKLADAKLIGINQQIAPIIRKKIALNPDDAKEENKSIVKIIDAENEKKDKRESLLFFTNLLFLFINNTYQYATTHL